MSDGGPAGPDVRHAQQVGTLADEAGQLLDAVAAKLAGLKSAAAVAHGSETRAGNGAPLDLNRPDDDGPDDYGPDDYGLDHDGPDHDGLDHEGAATHAEPEAAAEHPGQGRSCVGWCPICRSAELLQGERPELTEKLVDAALLVVTTLRSLIPQTPAAGPPTAGSSAASPQRSGVERIDIR